MTNISAYACRFQLALALVLGSALSIGTAQAVETVTYYHTDAYGTPVMESNSSAVVTYSREHTPYGKQVLGAPKNGPGITGHVADVDTGLTYMQARYYDPVASRFLSNDPVAAELDAGANFNRYWYANNNPYKFIDPDGREVVLYVRSAGHGATNFGHTAVRVYGKGYDVTYDFGRYRNSWGVLNSKGEGVLRVWKDAKAFEKTQAGKGDLIKREYKTSAKFDKAVIDHFLKQIQTDGSKTIESNKERTTHVLSKEYELQTNNCTTQSLNAIFAGQDATGEQIKELEKVREENDPRDLHESFGSKK